jgi:hypothetical protein
MNPASPVEDADWETIRIYGQGLDPHLGRQWECVPAWDVTAIHRQPDGEIRYKDQASFVFWNRHLDRRFHISYPHATRQSPRVVGRTIGETNREWDVLIEYRDRYLREARLNLRSPQAEIARCLADTFRAENFAKKPLATTFSSEARSLGHGIEGLLHKSNCVGCAYAYVLLADSCEFPVRAIGCDGHIVAEVLVDGSWRLVDSVGRHPGHEGWPIYFEASYMETALNPMGDFGVDVPEDLREGFFRRPSGQFHFHDGTWQGPRTLRFATSNAFALYPSVKKWGIKSMDGKRLPIIANRLGFYWPTVHWSDAEALQQIRRKMLPDPIREENRMRDFLYYEFKPGEKLRQSIYLGETDGLEQIEISFSFGASKRSDFSDCNGPRLVAKIGEFEKSLADLKAWPPQADESQNLTATIQLPAEFFRENCVHWIELHHRGDGSFFVPCVPSIMEPYLPPLCPAG